VVAVRRLLVVAVVVGLTAPVARAATAPTVTQRWTSPRQMAAVAVDDLGTVFAVDENTYGALVLRAYSVDGTQLWRRAWRPDGASLRAGDVALGPGGTVIVSGQIKPDPPGACDEIWNYGWAIAVWDDAGRLLWHRAQRGWRTCKAFATSGGAVASGGRTVALAIRQADEYSIHSSVLAFNLRGHPRWRYAFTARGSGHQWVQGLVVGAQGAVYLSGTFNVQMMDEGATDQEALVERLAPDGTRAWRRVAPDPRHRDEWAGGVSLAGGAVSFASLTDLVGPADRLRVASYATDGTLRWSSRIHDAVRSGWGDGFLEGRHDETLLATTRRDTSDRRHILVCAFARDGTRLWGRHLYRPAHAPTVATGLGADDPAIVVVGRPPRSSEDSSRVWVLQ
jgi:outer membrane protein assembly factor BamB